MESHTRANQQPTRDCSRAGSASTDDFDSFSEAYDKLLNAAVWGAANYYTEYKVNRVAALEQRNSVSALLDLGCGVGNATVRFRQVYPAANVYGVDVSTESIAVAQKRVANEAMHGADFRTYDGSRLPYGDEQFDIVFMAVVMHHVPVQDRSPLLREVLRVLRPGGRLYIFEHNPHNPITRKVVRECPFDENAILLTPRECRRLVGSSGFEPERVGFRVFVPPHRWLRWLLPIEDALEWLPIGGQYYVRGIKPVA
jgi:ubiquinone/menaquinone biosynthesis C-methylase UbiE